MQSATERPQSESDARQGIEAARQIIEESHRPGLPLISSAKLALVIALGVFLGGVALFMANEALHWIDRAHARHYADLQSTLQLGKLANQQEQHDCAGTLQPEPGHPRLEYLETFGDPKICVQAIKNRLRLDQHHLEVQKRGWTHYLFHEVGD
jgi:hypothetical protein